MMNIVIASLIGLSTGTPTLAPGPQGPQGCLVIPGDMKTSLEEMLSKFLQKEFPNLKKRYLDLWEKYEVEEAYRSAARTAVEKAGQKLNLKERIQLPWSEKKIQEFSQKVAQYLAEDSLLIHKLTLLNEELTQEVGAEAAERANRAASKAISCIAAYLKRNMGEAIADAFQEEISLAVEVERWAENPPSAQIPRWELIPPEAIISAVATIAFTGVKVSEKVLPSLIRRTMAEEAAKASVEGVARRTMAEEAAKASAASVARRVGIRSLIRNIFPRVIKGALIASMVFMVYDVKTLLFDAHKKVEAAILDTLTSTGTLRAFRDSLFTPWARLSDELPTHLLTFISDTLQDLWQNFTSGYQNLMDLAAAHPELHPILSALDRESLQEAAELATNLTEPQFLQAARSGALTELLRLPESYRTPAVRLAIELNSVEQALTWVQRAGTTLPTVLDRELYRYMRPEDASPQLIQKLSQLPQSTVQKLLSAEQTTTRFLLTLVPPDPLIALVDFFPLEDLASLADLLGTLDPDSRQYLLAQLTQNPAGWSKVKRIASDLKNASPAGRIDLIKLALSANPIEFIKKAPDHPLPALKLALEDRTLTILTVIGGLGALLFLMVGLTLILALFDRFLRILSALRFSRREASER